MTTSFHRREILGAGAVLGAALLPFSVRAESAFAPKPGAWRCFEIITRLEISTPEKTMQSWVPLPSVNESAWFRPNGDAWRTNGRAVVATDPANGARMLHVEWPNGEGGPFVEVTSNVAARDRAVDLANLHDARVLSDADRSRYLSGSRLIPIDGIVKETSDRIVAGTRTDAEKARAIYEWIVANTYRNPATRGCGQGDIAAMLRSGDLGGKCADINALLVGLVRAAGIPARDVYGVRVAPSQFGYKSLGANSEIVTKAQHCRAEVYLAGFGWTPVDPADVRKVILEEPPGNLTSSDAKVAAAREALFGSWEANWLAYNFSHDVTLPGSRGPKLPFLMYPQAEIAGVRLDCLDPDNLRYTIRSKEVTSI